MRAAAIFIGLIVTASIIYCSYYYRVELGLVMPQNHRGLEPAGRLLPATQGWQVIDGPGDRFSVEMPPGATARQLPAFAGDGTFEPVATIEAKLNPEITFAVSWADNPPVEKAGGESAERTLDLARDGALARTRTRLTSESRRSAGGFVEREFAAHSSNGGILNARFILTGSRLYMLTAAIPASGGQYDDDVRHFFSSFNMDATRPQN